MFLSGPDEVGGDAGKRQSKRQPNAGPKNKPPFGMEARSCSYLSLSQAQPDSSSPLAFRSLAPTLMCCSASAFFSSRYTVQMKSPACC